MLKGRLGLDSARIPHKDRHGLLWLARGALTVRDGTLAFRQELGGDLEAGTYDIPFQAVSCILIQPGTTVSHDALRILARHGTGLVAVGEDGVRLYASMPAGPDASKLARAQVTAWGDAARRVDLARRMYAWRLGEVFPVATMNELRGMEGARSRTIYRGMATKYRVEWEGRNFDRARPQGNDPINNAINHASVAVVAAAEVAVASVAAIPQLGFIHEESALAFCLDIADLYRDVVTLDVAFASVARWKRDGGDLERLVRRGVGQRLREQRIVAEMIDRITELFDDGGGDA